MPSASDFVTDFGSSMSAVRAVSRFLAGKDNHPLPGLPGSHQVANAVSRLPHSWRAGLYRRAAAGQGIPMRQVPDVDIDEVDRLITEEYGPGPFPAVVIGSPSGGAVHLAAALGAPFLPQTTLTAVKYRGVHPDDPTGAMTALAPVARKIARRNSDIAVYHMHDPAQDRPMIEKFAFMRLKRLALSPPYRKFLNERLAPGGLIIVSDASRTWRNRQVGERAYFQFGCLGGISEEEFHHSGERVAKFLEQQGSPVRAWDPPQMDGRRADGEWGWDDSLAEEVVALADRHGYGVRRMAAEDPQDHSSFIAELHRWWYRQLGAADHRLMVQTYAQWDPLWILRTRAVPYWIRFNTRPEHDELDRYLSAAKPYEHIHVNLMSHGVQSPGVVDVDQWRALAHRRAGTQGEVFGVDRQAYPFDAGSVIRYNTAFRDLPDREPIPEPLTVDDVDEFAQNLPASTSTSWQLEGALALGRN